MSKENLERVLDMANQADWEIASQAWVRYNRIVTGIAARHGFQPVIGAAVFAALSPNNDYLGNLRDSNRLLAAVRAGLGVNDFKVSTYGNNKIKAFRIATGENPLDLIVAKKTRNFFLNVSDPNNPEPVTIDGHIFNVWGNKRIALNSAEMKGYAKQYDDVADTIRQIGTERNLLPNLVQGLIWYCWKRIHKIKLDGQLEFWGSDYLVAGLGFQEERVTELREMYRTDWKQEIQGKW